MSNFTGWAKSELDIKLPDGDELNERMKRDLMELCEVFASQGHSGFSAAYLRATLHKLLGWEALTKITDNPDEWMAVEEDKAGNNCTWQSRRNPALFSNDGGKTYYSVNEFRTGWKRKLFGRKGKTYKSERVHN